MLQLVTCLTCTLRAETRTESLASLVLKAELSALLQAATLVFATTTLDCAEDALVETVAIWAWMLRMFVLVVAMERESDESEVESEAVLEAKAVLMVATLLLLKV